MQLDAFAAVARTRGGRVGGGALSGRVAWGAAVGECMRVCAHMYNRYRHVSYVYSVVLRLHPLNAR
jgi:hypothetical protein